MDNLPSTESCAHMFFARWFLHRSGAITAASARPVPTSLIRAENSLPGGGSQKSKFEERNRACRDQLYEVIREVMTRSGVLSASFKFKVLCLNKQASNYLVMIDLSGVTTDSAFRPAETEARMLQRAMKRHNISISAVYWRLNAMAAISKVPERSASHCDDSIGRVQPEETRASHNTLFAVVTPAAMESAARQTDMKLRSGLRASRHLHDFEETEVTSSGSYPALSATQYGELH